MRRILISWAMLLWCIGAQSQTPTDSTLLLSSDANRLGINTFDWHTTAQGVIRSRSQKHTHRYLLQNDWLYNQSLRDNRFVARDFAFSWQHQWLLRKNWFLAQQLIFNDFAANKTQIALYNVGTFTRWNPLPQHTVVPHISAGLATDKRFDRRDNGFYKQLRLQYLFNSQDSTLQAYTQGQWTHTQLNPRQNTAWNVGAGVVKTFSEQASMDLQAGYKLRRVEDYLASNIQSIQSDTMYARLRIYYAFSPKLHFRSYSQWEMPNRGFAYRNISALDNMAARSNSAYKQTELLSVQELIWAHKKLSASAKLELRQRDRLYGQVEDEAKDIREVTTTWYYNVQYRLSAKHALEANTFAQLLRVDTRSDLNNQDRDEVLYNSELAYNTRWTKRFRTSLKMSGAYKHLLYIEATQSIENYIERIVRLEPSFQWRTGRLSWNGQYGVWATYSVRDFASEQDKNRANRIFYTSHQWVYDVSKQYTLYGEILRRENRLGLLNWQKFAETPLDTIVTYDATVKLQKMIFYEKKAKGRVQLGYRIFRQSRKSTAGLNQAGQGSVLIALQNIIVQHGPKIMFAWQPNSRCSFEADVWVQQSINRNRYEKTTQLYVGRTYSPEQLEMKQKNLFPYFNVRLYWTPTIR